MALETQENDDDESNNFIAKLDNTKSIIQLLKAIQFKEIATICLNEQGLRVTVEDSKTVQANAFIQAGVFQSYSIKEECTFSINLAVLLECLNIFGSGYLPGVSTAVKMCYKGFGSPLALVLEEGGVLTDCHLNTTEADDILDFNLSNENVVNKIIMKSELLKDSWNDLDQSSETIEILFSPNKPYLKLSTFGSAGTVNIEFSRDSEMIESFSCTQTQTNRYKMSLIKPSSKALNVSTRISMRTDDRGLLCLQYMIKVEGDEICFVEYFCAPDENVDDN